MCLNHIFFLVDTYVGVDTLQDCIYIKATEVKIHRTFFLTCTKDLKDNPEF